MRKVISFLLTLVLTCLVFPMTACSSKTEQTVLRICNCEDYIDEDLLSKFEEENPDIKVEYSTYGTNENLYNELVINPNSYDLVVPSEYMIQKLATEGMLNKLDRSKVENYTPSPYIENKLDNITFTIEKGEYEGEEANLSEFLVGYMWGTMGWVINPETVDPNDASSWGYDETTGVGILGNPAYNKKATVKDSIRDTYLVALGLVYRNELVDAVAENDNAKITEIFNRTDVESVKKVGDTLSSLKGGLYGFEVDSGKNDIVSGKIDAYVAWSGDAAYAIDEAAEKDIYLDYVVPDEGSNIWFDGLVMPSGSKNYDAVYRFLDFICEPENVVQNMAYIGYSSIVANEDVYNDIVLDWFDESEDLEEGEGLEVDLSWFFTGEDGGDYTVVVSEECFGRLVAQYPTMEIVNRCAVMNYFDNETLTRVNEMWEVAKGETFPLWVIIVVLAFIVLLAVAIVLYRKKESIKWFSFKRSELTYGEKHGLKVVKKEDLYN